jgi:arginine transport system substrate-binding protein
MQNNIRYGAAILTAIFCGFFTYKIHSSRAPKNIGNAPLHIGVASGYAPWAIVAPDGTLEGFDVDIARELASRLNRSLILTDMSPEILIASVKGKKLDLMVAPMAITPEREEVFHMIHYQGTPTDHWPLMFLNKVPEHIASLDDLATIPKIVVCVLPGTKQAEYIQSFSRITMRTLDSMALMLMEVRQGKSAAALVDPDLGMHIKKGNPNMAFLQIKIPKEYQSRGNGITINRKNNELAEQVRAAITSMKNDGFIAQKEKSWKIGRLS